MKLFSLVSAFLSLLLISTLPVSAQSASLDPAVKAALNEGAEFQQRHQLSSALDSDRKALKLAHGACTECREAIVNLQLNMDLYKDAASSAAAWAQQASNSLEKSHAEYLQAQALMHLNTQKPNPALLHQAADILQHAATEAPTDADIHMLRGRVLAALNMDADAKAEFVACAATPGASPNECTRANNFAADVSLARGEAAPAFSIDGPNGSPVTLDSLAGKVVLIDFWATWCGPCNRDLDYIQSIASEFSGDNFVLLGVSSDSKESDWTRYKEKNHMRGIQVRDSFEGLNSLFHVAGIPTYIVIDANGIIRLRVTGVEGDIRGKIRTLLAKPSLPPASNPTAQLAIPPPTR